jgi:hypothetical protein
MLVAACDRALEPRDEAVVHLDKLSLRPLATCSSPRSFGASRKHFLHSSGALTMRGADFDVFGISKISRSLGLAKESPGLAATDSARKWDQRPQGRRTRGFVWGGRGEKSARLVVRQSKFGTPFRF